VRKKAQRKKLHQRGPTAIIEAHERAGDVAREHHFHAAAAQHYQDALSVATPTNGATALSDDHNRILEKLIQALFLSGEPDAAKPLYYRLLTSYLATPGNGAKAIDTMLNIARQLWIDSKTTEALPVVMQAIQLAERIGERSLGMQANLAMHNHYTVLGHYQEATQFLNSVGRVENEHTASLRMAYYGQRALAAAIAGQATKAYRHYEQVFSIAKKEIDLYRLVATWKNYSYSALVLGDVDRAKSCTERALLISREHCFIWFIPFLCLEYANILALIGQSSSAYEYLIEGLSSEARVPILERVLAETGIPLALQMRDEATLAKCVRPTALALAFQSEEPEGIGAVAAAFAKLYNVRGEGEKAQALLHRAVEAVRPTAYGWQLPLAVAQYGAMADISRARALLEARTIFPCSAVAQACLCLFDAHIARRKNTRSWTHTHAKAALKRFETLGWHAHADEARSLLPYVRPVPHPSREPSLPFTDLQSVLTVREQQVAQLVLKGFTNRKIAADLSVSENTVETHMASIMNRLGIRSRHQLTDVLTKAGG
jgi:ATP/maltotriose-dependent transcriptional regulator MalT